MRVAASAATPPDVRQLPDDGVAVNARLTAAGAPAGTFGDLLGLHDSAREHRVIGSDVLAGDSQPQPIEQTERVEIRIIESRFIHVEVFQMGSVRTSIIGEPRRAWGCSFLP